LNSQLEDLQKELSDVNLSGVSSFSGIDSVTRTIDFWFDNIFTDLNVRSRIRNDNESLRSLREKINDVIKKLDSNKSEILEKLNDIELRKNALIISE
jgi:hypothetical protein